MPEKLGASVEQARLQATSNITVTIVINSGIEYVRHIEQRALNFLPDSRVRDFADPDLHVGGRGVQMLCRFRCDQTLL